MALTASLSRILPQPGPRQAAADRTPLRAELFNLDQLRQHARGLAATQQIDAHGRANQLLLRLTENERLLLRAYDLTTAAAGNGQRLPPAAEWLLDNFYLIEQQIRLARRHLPHTYVRQLPPLRGAPLAGYPRVYAIALELISHVDGRVDAENLSAFVAAYQTVTPLQIGELWAVPIMLRLALIENVRRVAGTIAYRHEERNSAATWADRLLKVSETAPARLPQILADFARANPSLTSAFVQEFFGKLQGRHSALGFVLNWVEHRLSEQGLALEQLLRTDSQALAADQLSIGNSINSLRLLNALDWQEFVETLSAIEVALRADPAGVYGAMSFSTRDRYRHCVEEIARRSPLTEEDVARTAVRFARAAKGREAHVGFYLIDKGRRTLENAVECRPAWHCRVTRAFRRYPLPVFVTAVVALTAGATATLLYGIEGPVWLLAGLTGLAASQMAVSVVMLLATQMVRPHLLPRLDYCDGIPSDQRTMVVVPTLLTNPAAVAELLEQLEVRYLGNRDQNLSFALLTDFPDSLEQTQPGDAALVQQAQAGIEALNEKYHNGTAHIFFLFHRPRVWNPHEKLWLGWERKRGKLEQFNALLRGGSREPFSVIVGDPAILPSLKYVITLDSDTQLPRDAAYKLVGTIAHPLNRPVFDPATNCVVAGYAILQPRVSINLPAARRSHFARLFAGEPGVDPYTHEVSDVYQDLFAEGSYVGKGIYDVAAFHRAVGGRFPENLILSHDLLEGCYARSGLVTDVELVEDHPASYCAEASRRHRWIRGDWQIAGWLGPRVPGSARGRERNPLPALAQWKIFDNLRRTLVAPALLLLLAVGWGTAPESAGRWTMGVVTFVLAPAVLAAVLEFIGKPRERSWRFHLNLTGHTLSRQLARALLGLAFIPYRALLNLDAIWQSAVRKLFTRRGLFLWHTPAYARRNARTTLGDFCGEMWLAPVTALVALAYFVSVRPTELQLTGALLALWLAAPVLGWWISRSLKPPPVELPAKDRQFLEMLAHRTWRYFEEFVGPADNWLPPDNFQEVPTPALATRTSPTNIGVGLLANLAAHDFAFISTAQLLERTEKTLATLERLERYRGHFYNWYDTRTLKPLPPAYVSSVDSGNLLASLWTLRAGLLELKATPGTAQRQIDDLAQRCTELATMDFTFLYDAGRELLTIGYNVSDRRRDTSHYDLLASEARLASFLLIAQGQLPQEHWFAMGRQLTRANGSLALISWSGSMFEYLLPLLFTPTYENTLLDQTCKAVVARQIEYGRERGVPWGISESCYSATDAQRVYQYRAFGVPGLGFKRGLGDDLVIAPYATALALAITPHEACRNLHTLAAHDGYLGAYGFYEAVDFTRSRLRRGKKQVVVRTFMAHHQGMTLLALAHLLRDRPMQRRFMADPSVRATEMLLQERIPKIDTLLQPHEAEVTEARKPIAEPEPMMRVFKEPNTPLPEVHLLSNGRYHVMATNSGGGYSRWNDLAVTRWREDGTRDNWGTFCYLRDLDRGTLWSTAYQPTLRASKTYEAIFLQARAEYRRRDEELDVHTEICVSPEDDVEVRRVTLTNLSRRVRQIELTTYAEVVLAPPNADLAHPAFSNLFVQTELVRDRHAILCTRRPRSERDAPVWLLHLLTVPEASANEPSYETDRAKFIGRGRTPTNPLAFTQTGALSGTEGSVLDPIVAIRRTVTLKPDESAVVHIISGIAPARDAAVGLIDKYRDPRFVERAFEMAWSHSQIALRHLNATEADAQVFSELASSVLHLNPPHRIQASVIARNRRGQSSLWPYSLSGDLPIVLLRIADINRLELVRQTLQAHAYWHAKGLATDLVILNEDFSGYRQVLQDRLLELIAAGPEPGLLNKPGGVLVQRAEQMADEDRILFQTVARVVLTDSAETLAEQSEQRVPVDRRIPRFAPTSTTPANPAPPPPLRELLFFNGLGGFTPDGREYIITLNPGQTTPAPWANVIANAHIGSVVSESGSAYTWVENAHEFRLTPWHNDPLADTTGEAFYIRDEETGRFWSPTPLPARDNNPYVCRHGFGYSVFEHTADGIYSEVWTYVAPDAPVKFVVVKLRNLSGRARRLSVTGYWELVLGQWRHTNALHIITETYSTPGLISARNAYNREFAGRVVFAHTNGPGCSVTGNRVEFLGRNGTLAQPAALNRAYLSGKVGAGLDPCAALQTRVELAAGAETEEVFLLGAGPDTDSVKQLIQQHGTSAGARQALEAVWEYWKRTLGTVFVETPDNAVNMLANGWLVYQTLACRYWGRSGYYQSGGAYGFRDQLQDSLALVHAAPHLTREHLVRCAAHQFREGDVQHWWHPPSDRGVRTHFSDDYLWLPYAACRYVTTTGDVGVLEERVAFLEGRAVNPEEEGYYDLPARGGELAPVYEHCVRAIQYGLKFGAHGLPLMGCGDWNDGMNLVGQHGKGESVWLAFFLCDVLQQFAELARQRGDATVVDLCTSHAAQLRANIELHAWDGQWYRRAYFDDGTPLGSATNPECQIDSIAQSWAVLSGAAEPARARLGMAAVDKRLVRRDARLIKLFDPPFDKSALQPGYIKGYVPGVRENGGQYTHGAIWTVMAFAQLGDAERTWELFNLINPIHHGADAEAARVYKVEPYVVAADVYGRPPHTGRGGWTWYTGSAGWLYRLIVETILGVQLENNTLRFRPCIPGAWDSYKIHYRYRATLYHITVRRLGDRAARRVARVVVDGVAQPEPVLALVDDQREHQVDVELQAT